MLEPFKLRIEDEIAAIELPSQPARLYEPIRYMLAMGGKRIRPMLALLAAELYGEEGVSAAMPVALAIELFHNFTLMHDDIMDQAPLRRGRPTVHQQWNADVAILSGDNLLILAYQQLAKSPPAMLPVLFTVFNRMAQEVCEGQQRDMDYEMQTEMISEAAYLEMIRQKTAVLLGASLKMGALSAGAPAKEADLLNEFGVAIGIAFQLQDDLLDVYGDPESFGKQMGGDILANKKSILLVSAYREATTAQRRQLAEWLAFEDYSDPLRANAKIEGVKQLYDSLQVEEIAERLKEKFIKQAFACLDRLEGTPKKLQKLRALAQSLLQRER